ncbi:hypothetical protein [Subtercola boreus]|uniref:Cell division protein FtsL n=1 Tax=Subtercola boreus TaxID=120213 RepID=A0A3E0WB66_9MICO|nr:hypothetical protein [Subtercola boreus]RFA21090.1 hypothetical protein B7R24_06725 [Subtercola boreus]RFA21474.1 hypothetical protein B7R23_06670 [Subtercola boreus]RFA27445.1 hypothetical protein B7R25_06795 [Subtercola boreus]
MTSIAPARSPRASGAATAVAEPFDDPFDDAFLGDYSPPAKPKSRFTIATSNVLRRRKPKLAYAAVVVVGVFSIVVAQLTLSIGLSNGAYEIESLQSQQKELDRTNGALTEQLDGLSAPQSLAANAESLGMVANVHPAYLRLSDGAVLGTPQTASGASGSLTNGQPSLVPNALTSGAAAAAAAAAQAATDAATTAAAASSATATGTPAPTAGTPVATPSAPSAAAATAAVPWQGQLPAPTTH